VYFKLQGSLRFSNFHGTILSTVKFGNTTREHEAELSRLNTRPKFPNNNTNNTNKVALAGGSETAAARIESLQQKLQELQAEHNNQRLQEVKEEAESSAGKQEAILEQQREELANQKSELEAACAYQQ